MESKRPLNKAFPPEEIQRDSVCLQRIQLASAETIYRTVISENQRLARFLPWVDNIQTLADEENFIQDSLNAWDAHEAFVYCLYREEDDAYLGNIAVNSVAWDYQRCEVGYWLKEEYIGNGYMTSAVYALENAMFDLGFTRIEILCTDDNAMSIRVAERCGYQFEWRLAEQLIYAKTIASSN